MANKPHKNFKYGIYLILLIILLLAYDFYYNYQENPDIWNTEWFRWRIAMILIAAAGGFFYAWVRKAQKSREAHKELTKKIIRSHEEEWKQIAAELHDSVGQYLTFVNNQVLQIANSMNGEGKKDELMTVSRNIIITVDEIRRIMSKIYPHQLERLGFKKAVESLVVRAESSSGLKINSEIENISGMIADEDLINLYRIMQEALNNIVKHSGAKNVFINIYTDSHYIYLNIEDDGKGISSGEHAEQFYSGYGIDFMKERVSILGGKIRFDSKPGVGTKISIMIPKKILGNPSK